MRIFIHTRHNFEVDYSFYRMEDNLFDIVDHIINDIYSSDEDAIATENQLCNLLGIGHDNYMLRNVFFQEADNHDVEDYDGVTEIVSLMIAYCTNMHYQHSDPLPEGVTSTSVD